MANFLVSFIGHRGRIVVDASSMNEAKNTAFKYLDVPRSFILVEEREDVWAHVVLDDIPVMRDGSGCPTFLRANAAPVVQYQFSIEFLSEIVGLAQEIAFHQRGETSLQSVKKLQEKFHEEKQELRESKNPEEEIPDVVYYGCQLASLGQYRYLKFVERQILPRYQWPQQQVEAITLAKYRLRAAGPNSKDLQREREAIQEALR